MTFLLVCLLLYPTTILAGWRVADRISGYPSVAERLRQYDWSKVREW